MPICSIDVRRIIHFAKHTFLSGKKLPQKTVNGILTSSTTCYLRHVSFDQLYSQISPQSKISIANINKTRCLLSGIHIGDNFRHVRARSKMAAPLRPSRKHCFFIKITISQYHDIDISCIDIDIGKMTSR